MRCCRVGSTPRGLAGRGRRSRACTSGSSSVRRRAAGAQSTTWRASRSSSPAPPPTSSPERPSRWTAASRSRAEPCASSWSRRSLPRGSRTCASTGSMWTSWRRRRPPSSARASPTTRGSSRARARPSPPSSLAQSRAKDLGARAVDFETLLREADVVTFHVPLTPETENMVAARELARMKRGVRLVNCARGGIVNEADLLAALESEHVAGVAIDVWSEEPPAGEPLRRLIQHPRVVVTPHLGANSGEAQVNVAVDVARQLVAFRDGGLVEHAVNIPLGDPAAVAELRPFVALADRLRRLSVQPHPQPPQRPQGTPPGAIAQAGPQPPPPAGPPGVPAPPVAGPP